LSSFWKDIRFGLRTLAKTPGTTLAALIALALGIGANSAIFSVVSGVLLRPLPYPEPDRLMSLMNNNPQAGLPRFPLSIPDFEDYRRQTRSFEGLTAYMTGRFNLTGGDRPEAIQGAAVTAGFFHSCAGSRSSDRPSVPRTSARAAGRWWCSPTPSGAAASAPTGASSGTA